MNVWLDDERDPTSTHVKDGFGSDGTEVWVKTADEAIELLQTGKVEWISLDHDLGRPEYGNGMHVAEFIEKGAFDKTLPPLQWRIHSMNPVGRKSMAMALKNADKYWEAV
jgi:hypothetical protein